MIITTLPKASVFQRKVGLRFSWGGVKVGLGLGLGVGDEVWWRLGHAVVIWVGSPVRIVAVEGEMFLIIIIIIILETLLIFSFISRRKM